MELKQGEHVQFKPPHRRIKEGRIVSPITQKDRVIGAQVCSGGRFYNVPLKDLRVGV